MTASILIVEDDPLTAQLLQFVFEREQCDVTWLADGQQAQSHLQEQPPADTVLLDLMLPHVDGLDLLKQLRSRPAWQHSRVMVLSARDQTSDIRQAFALGADDYMTKPFDPQELLVRVQRWSSPRPA
ncbi:MAG: Alkaline phosphatase synthesis transcriptional regulatory protein PhoP [Pseudomonadota bacterium]|jgi:DNA-binding response OmpR family regulator